MTSLWEWDEMLLESKGKGAKLLQHKLFRQQALLWVASRDEQGQAVYKCIVDSCLQEHSAGGSIFFPHFFSLPIETSAAAIAAAGGRGLWRAGVVLHPTRFLASHFQQGQWQTPPSPGAGADCIAASNPSSTPRELRGDPFQKLGLEQQGCSWGRRVMAS